MVENQDWNLGIMVRSVATVRGYYVAFHEVLLPVVCYGVGGWSCVLVYFFGSALGRYFRK